MTNKGKAGTKAKRADDKGNKGNKSANAGDDGKAAKGCQQINVRHILCEKHGKKEDAVAKLQGGAKFDDVAREFSEDKARAGGALGWKKRGDLDLTFETVAFDLAASTTANPTYAEVKTDHGYHIVMVEGRK